MRASSRPCERLRARRRRGGRRGRGRRRWCDGGWIGERLARTTTTRMAGVVGRWGRSRSAGRPADDQRRRTDGDGVAWRRGWARYRAVVVTTDRGGAERMVTPRGVVLRERRDDNRGFAAGRRNRTGVAAVFSSTEGLGFEWSSEGDLVAQLAKRYGNARTVKIMNAYRSSWLTKQDLAGLRDGFRVVAHTGDVGDVLGSERQPSR